MTKLKELQDRTAAKIVERLTGPSSRRNSLLYLTGAAGSGKTTILRRMADHLRREGCWIPILVSAPDGEHDAGPIALLETAGQLVENEILDGETQVLADPRRSWTEKMATITRAVDRRDDVVLLCDEPAGWYHRDESLLEHTPDYSARSFAEWIAAGALCRRVIAGWIPGNAGPAVPVDVPQLADGRDILDVEADWDVLWEPASRLRKSVSDPLPFRSAMEMKLCVALASLLPRDEPVALSKSDASAKVILERLFDQVERRAEFCGFCATLARLALVRTPLRKAVVDEFTAGLEPPARSVIEICLLDRYDGRAALHPLVRNQVRGRATRRVEGVPRERCQPWRLRKERLKEVHDRLKGEYDDKTKGPPRDSLESFHHELLGSGADLRHSAGRIQFVEQLDEIGRTLSHRQRDHGRAVEVYRLAVELFPDHAYSQHYLAYNLDWMARETKELEAHYQKAIELQPRHPWFWSRWISYLATRGRNGEARAQWHEAVRALSISGDETPSWIFRGLHRWVARWLLHWAELDFAEMVLREIPRWLARQDTGIQALWSLLEALRQAERGDSVFPLSVPPREWRSPAPHTDLPRRFQDAPLLGAGAGGWHRPGRGGRLPARGRTPAHPRR